MAGEATPQFKFETQADWSMTDADVQRSALALKAIVDSQKDSLPELKSLSSDQIKQRFNAHYRLSVHLARFLWSWKHEKVSRIIAKKLKENNVTEIGNETYREEKVRVINNSIKQSFLEIEIAKGNSVSVLEMGIPFDTDRTELWNTLRDAKKQMGEFKGEYAQALLEVKQNGWRIKELNDFLYIYDPKTHKEISSAHTGWGLHGALWSNLEKAFKIERK